MLWSVKFGDLLIELSRIGLTMSGTTHNIVVLRMGRVFAHRENLAGVEVDD